MEEAIRRILEERQKLIDEAAGLTTSAEGEKRGLNKVEQERFTAIGTEIDEMDARVADLKKMEERSKASAATAVKVGDDKRSPARVTPRSSTYGRRQGNSFFLDLVRSQVNHDERAQERLLQHRKEEQDDLEKRLAKMEAEAEKGMDELREQVSRDFRRAGVKRGADVEIERRDISRTAGAGGEFVPPLWLIGDYITLARAARATADLCTNRPLPPDTNSINIPRITGGTAVRSQASLGNVQKTDITTNALTVNVETLAGQQDIELQLIEQTPIDFDEMIFADLTADYAQQLNIQVVSGAGHGSNQLLGILNVSGIGSSTYTSGSPTVPGLYPKGADVMQQVASNRKLPPTATVLHTRRWGWMCASLDANNRPLVVPGAPNQPFNAMAVNEEVLAQGSVGTWLGLDLVADPSVPVNLGAGTNEDRIITARFPDFWLWESFLRTRVLPEVLSNSLEVRLQLYNYVAFAAGRYGSSTAVVAGTGLVTPTF